MSGTEKSLRDTIGTLRHLERTIDVSPSKLPSSITNPVHSGSYLNTTIAAAVAPPPLVTQLQSYIKRELVLNSGGASIPSAMDQLGPYREAFRALRTAFPAYALLFDDIQCAYDNAIQAQAELLTNAFAAVDAGNVQRVIHVENSNALHQQVSELQADLAKMEMALESRVQAEEGRQSDTQEKSRKKCARDVLELHRELDAANQRIIDLEHCSKSDLEKIVVLIGAVRECDRRLKEYERLVTSVTGQISELDEFKRIAGDAQAELLEFRMKYSDYVPVDDFHLMKDYLTSELEGAQLMIRRWRRTAAVRGTQLDVMLLRLKALEEDRAALVKEAAASAAMEPSDTNTVLTPRPSWKRVYERYPELSGYAADVGHLTTELDRDVDGDTIMEGGNSGVFGGSSTSLVYDGDMPVVKGPKETALQVEYLVQRIVALEGLVRTQTQQQQEQGTHASTANLVEGGGTSFEKVHSKTENWQEGGLIPENKLKDASASRKPRISRTRAPAEGLPNATGAAPFTSSVPHLAPPLELPLLGLGYGTHIPLCWRASGVLLRRSVAPATILSIVYSFFLNVLPTFIEQEDKAQQSDNQSDAFVQGSTMRLGAYLHELLLSEIHTREDLQAYDSVAHLLMNLERDAMKQEWYTDALNLLLWVARGLLPPRIAVDAVVVVAQVKRDLRSLAKELQSSRLRRQALSECLQPVLELKTASELDELRAVLQGETTFSAGTLSSDTHPFMQVLLVQECRAGMDLYVSFLRALTARAVTMTVKDGRVVTSASASVASRSTRESKAPPPPQLAEGDRVLSLADISAAILEVEPLTPEVVLREVSLNAVSTAIPVASSAHARGEVQGGATALRTGVSEESPVVVRLSDMVRVVGAAPLIRRTVRSSKNECSL
ncbi:hypothetical protein JKF63_03042 [Porcisia hertigi]|uniref:Translin-associated factor X-interacting protein 1 N-terminal domain-containing protein n=1 Tax=Porcisia hertigi TaxID=2761500 RepID=A0A836L576_9TRYP|nr:hypothetical protein JKF63_03042 [Porcisia hertigi]